MKKTVRALIWLGTFLISLQMYGMKSLLMEDDKTHSPPLSRLEGKPEVCDHYIGADKAVLILKKFYAQMGFPVPEIGRDEIDSTLQRARELNFLQVVADFIKQTFSVLHTHSISGDRYLAAYDGCRRDIAAKYRHGGGDFSHITKEQREMYLAILERLGEDPVREITQLLTQEGAFKEKTCAKLVALCKPAKDNEEKRISKFCKLLRRFAVASGKLDKRASDLFYEIAWDALLPIYKLSRKIGRLKLRMHVVGNARRVMTQNENSLKKLYELMKTRQIEDIRIDNCDCNEGDFNHVLNEWEDFVNDTDEESGEMNDAELCEKFQLFWSDVAFLVHRATYLVVGEKACYYMKDDATSIPWDDRCRYLTLEGSELPPKDKRLRQAPPPLGPIACMVTLACLFYEAHLKDKGLRF